MRRRRRAITEDGDDNDEDGVDCVGHFVMGRTSQYGCFDMKDRKKVKALVSYPTCGVGR